MLGCGPRRERPLPDMSHFPTTEARRADPAAQSLGVSHHSSGPGPGPLLQHPAPLPDHQPRPRSPLAVGREQRAGLFEAVAGEQQPLDVPTVLGPPSPVRRMGHARPPGLNRQKAATQTAIHAARRTVEHYLDLCNLVCRARRMIILISTFRPAP
jgi:hypothetical protein